jgi:hypothetical protein
MMYATASRAAFWCAGDCAAFLLAKGGDQWSLMSQNSFSLASLLIA